MAIREGRWDCSTCGGKAILGRHTICPHCGDPRPAGVRFYLPENEPEVTDQKQLETARAGPDWLCRFCGSSNRASAAFCEQCGAERGAAPTQNVRDYAAGQTPRTGGSPSEISPAKSPLKPRLSPKRPALRLPRQAIKLGVMIALAVLVAGCGILWLVNRPRDVTLKVVAKSWQRSVAIEALRTVAEEGWSVPPGGRVQSSQLAVHHYDSVLDHYETRSRQISYQEQVGEEEYVSGQRDLGNGFFEDIVSKRPIYETRQRTETYQEPVYRQEPVLQTRYSYLIERWVHDRVEQASGSNDPPRWPTIRLKQNEREAARSASYLVRFAGPKNKTFELRPSEDKWRQFQVGEQYRAKVSGLGRLIEVTP